MQIYQIQLAAEAFTLPADLFEIDGQAGYMLEILAHCIGEVTPGLATPQNIQLQAEVLEDVVTPGGGGGTVLLGESKGDPEVQFGASCNKVLYATTTGQRTSRYSNGFHIYVGEFARYRGVFVGPQQAFVLRMVNMPLIGGVILSATLWVRSVGGPHHSNRPVN